MNYNISMLTDLYQITMAYGYFKSNKHNDYAVFDLFYRKHLESQFVVVAGIEQAIQYVENLHFDKDDIEYLRSLNLFDDTFLSYLLQIKFNGKIYAMDEGTIAFPNEPIIRVEGSILECQLLETTLLNIINHQTLIATKANRIVREAFPNPVMEFGLRRAQGNDAALYGTRASYIAGCESTSNVLAGQKFGIQVQGTHAHSWIMSFDTELQAFEAYANNFPSSCVLLIDTYDVINSGIPNAIKTFNNLVVQGYKPLGVRLDSGDLSYLSKIAREKLDEAGFTYAKIFATNDLDEYTIQSLKLQGAKIDVYGVGTKLITSYNMPALGGVYKLSEINGSPKMKLSENIEKTTNPSKKMPYRLFDKITKKAVADLIMMDDEIIDDTKPLTIYHSVHSWKKLVLENIYSKPLLSLYYDKEVCKDIPTLIQSRENLKENLNSFWEEYLRLNNPQEYKVDISDKLYDLKKDLIEKYQGE